MLPITNNQGNFQKIHENAEECQQKLGSFQKKNEKPLKAKRMNSAISRLINTNRKIAKNPLVVYEEVEGLYNESRQGEDDFYTIVKMWKENGCPQWESVEDILQSVSNVRLSLKNLVGELNPGRKLF